MIGRKFKLDKLEKLISYLYRARDSLTIFLLIGGLFVKLNFCQLYFLGFHDILKLWWRLSKETDEPTCRYLQWQRVSLTVDNDTCEPRSPFSMTQQVLNSTCDDIVSNSLVPQSPISLLNRDLHMQIISNFSRKNRSNWGSHKSLGIRHSTHDTNSDDTVFSVFCIRDIFVRIRIMQIRGSVTMTNGSGSGSCYFRPWPSRFRPKTIFSFFVCFSAYYCLKVRSTLRNHKIVGIKVFLTIFAWW